MLIGVALEAVILAVAAMSYDSPRSLIALVPFVLIFGGGLIVGIFCAWTEIEHARGSS